MSTEPKPPCQPLQIFMKFLPFYLIIEVLKAPTISKTRHGNFTPCPVLKKVTLSSLYLSELIEPYPTLGIAVEPYPTLGIPKS